MFKYLAHWPSKDEISRFRKLEHSGNTGDRCGYVSVSHVSVAAFSTEPEHFFSRFRQISVSGITYFRNRYHVNKLRKREITFGNKFVSFSSFGGNVELRSGYVSFFSVSVRFRCINYVDVSKELLAHADAYFPCR